MSLTKNQQLVRIVIAAIYPNTLGATKDDLLQYFTQGLQSERNMGNVRVATILKIAQAEADDLGGGSAIKTAFRHLINNMINSRSENSDVKKHGEKPIKNEDFFTPQTLKNALTPYVPDLDVRLENVNSALSGRNIISESPVPSGFSLEEVESIICTQLVPGSPGYNGIMERLREKLTSKNTRALAGN